MRARRAAALLGLGLVASLLLGGCWDQVEIEELAFALAVGLDQGTGGNLAVTLQVAVPPPQGSGAASGGGPGASARPLVTTVMAPDVPSALNLASAYLNRRVVLTDSEAVVIGLPLARQGIQQLMDQFVRLRESRRTQLLLVAEPTAQAVLRAFDPPLEVNLANAFENARYLQTITGLMPVLGLHNVLSAIESASGDAVAGLLAVQGAPMATGSPGAQPSTALPRTGPNPVNLIGAVAFAADRAVGVLSGRQTAILNLLRGDVLDVTLTVPDPFMPSRLDTLEVRPVAAPSVHVDTATPTPRIAESVPLELRLQSEMGLENYAARASSRRVLEAAALAVLEGQAATLVRTAQTQWRSDIFGFGDAARRNFATQGQLSDYDWARAFPRASVAVTFTAKTFQVGEQLQPPLPGD